MSIKLNLTTDILGEAGICIGSFIWLTSFAVCSALNRARTLRSSSSSPWAAGRGPLLLVELLRWACWGLRGRGTRSLSFCTARTERWDWSLPPRSAAILPSFFMPIRTHFLTEETDRSEERRISRSLLPSTVTALITFVLIDGTNVLMLTYIGCVFSHTSSKEAFATVARNGAVMLSCNGTKDEFGLKRSKSITYPLLDHRTQHNLVFRDCSRRCYCSLNWFLEPLSLILLVRHDQDQDIRHWFRIWYSSLFHRNHRWERHVALETKKGK